MAQQVRTVSKPRFYYGWVIVATVALASFSMTAGTFPVLSVLLGPINEEFGWSRTTFTAATTLGTLAGGVVSILVSRVIDRLGGRWILTGALFLLGWSFILTAFMHSMWQFYALQIMGRALTMGVVALVLQTIVPKWFIAKRGLAVSIAGLGGMIGNTVTPLYVQRVLVIADWRTAAFVAGVVIWVVSVVPIALFMRRQPEDMGLLPDGQDTAPSGPTASKAQSQITEDSFTLPEVLRFPAFYLLTASFTLLFMVGPIMGLHLLPYLQGKGLTADQGVLILATWAGSGAVGALVAGFAVAKLGPRRTLTGAFVLMAGGFAALLLLNTFATALLWGVYMGLLLGAIFITLYQVTLAGYFGRQSLGKINGAIWPVQMLANASGPLAAAIAFDTLGNYNLVFVSCAGLILASALMTSLARPPKRLGSNGVPMAAVRV